MTTSFISRVFREAISRPAARAGLAAAAMLALAACSSTQGTGSQDAASPARSIGESVGFATTTPEPAEFVKASRPAQMDYMAVGVTPPARGTKPKTPAEVKKMEQELAATRARNAKQAQ